MVVVGVQPVGSRGLLSVQAIVVEPRVESIAAQARPGAADIPAAVARAVAAETVFFPREGTPTDPRPYDMRRRRAARRYRQSQHLLDGDPYDDGDEDEDDGGYRYHEAGFGHHDAGHGHHDAGPAG